MREIKFRGKRIDNKEWAVGSLLSRNDSFGALSLIEVQDKETFEISTYMVYPDSVGMFTGLKDKNGKHIYEGDIITHQKRSKPFSEKAKLANIECLVQWDNGYSEAENKSNPSSFNRQPGFAAHPIDRNAKGADWGHDWSEFHNCEITGNIHDEVKPTAKGAVINNMNNNFDPGAKAEQEEATAEVKEQPAEQASEATETTGEGALVD